MIDVNSLLVVVNYTYTKNDPYKKDELILGCVLSIGGNLLISISLNIQKYVHIKNNRLQVPLHYTLLPLWWFGLTLMVFGELGNFVAFGLAPASMVAPLGTTTVIANMVIAVVFLKEKLRPEDIFGTTLALIGACLIVNFSARMQYVMDSAYLTELIIKKPFIIYFILEMIIIIALLVMLYRFKVTHILVLLGIGSIFASITVITAKGVSALLTLTFNGNNQMRHPIIYIYSLLLFVTAALQVIYLNMAMQLYYSTVVVPTNFVLFTISAILAGISYYREFEGLNGLQIFMFLFGCLLSCIGVYFIQLNRENPAELKRESTPEGNSASPDDMISSRTSVQSDWMSNQVIKTPIQPPIKNED